ncbi:MAG: hypothetical protein V4708_15165, partial [Bacteroidota bacterium]
PFPWVFLGYSLGKRAFLATWAKKEPNKTPSRPLLRPIQDLCGSLLNLAPICGTGSFEMFIPDLENGLAGIVLAAADFFGD